ncbi:Thioredoxin [Parasponia andersonii]|uniref:Thioredoxin-like 4, chloroplastic n=1 Tax=Parasponia andersonii TaxID=3476 RepID=A0A2P5CVL7_PARAD|nr:Thioredoxin [Parasponia andersonii]
MQRQNAFHCKALFSFRTNTKRQLRSSAASIFSSSLQDRSHARLWLMRSKISLTLSHTIRRVKIKAADWNQGDLSDEDEDLCPVDCVREFKTDSEFFKILDKAKEDDSLVVVDFYRTSCGSCKYIEQGFAKLCRGSGDEEASVVFLKHNVIDEYDEQSEVAERLRIKTVPLFHFYKNGVLLESFPTRDKEKIVAAIRKYTSPASQII